jgi:hypothetical protein
MFRLALIFAIVILPTAAFAEVPFQFAAPNLRAPDDPDVNGVRLSVLHGRNASVRGFDVGVLSMSETRNLSGFSAIFGIGRVTGEMNGCASALMNLHSSRDSGLNAAFINRIHTLERGANVAFINVADGFTMVDVGGLNVSDRSKVQVGFVNVTKKLDSVQIGFINAAENGFLPVFPFFNFPKPQ